MKRPIFYTLVSSMGLGFKYRLLKVTSIKNSQVYGRDEHDEATHCARRDCRGRFETEEAAVSVIDSIQEANQKYSDLREPHEKSISELYRTERDLIDVIISRAGAERI